MPKLFKHDIQPSQKVNFKYFTNITITDQNTILEYRPV